MMNLLPHQRFHIPNSLAVFAAVLLLITSAVGFESRQEVHSSSQDIITSVKVKSAEKSRINDSVQKKRRGLNLGLPLFRRG
jgi:hypothetical protein